LRSANRSRRLTGAINTWKQKRRLRYCNRIKARKRLCDLSRGINGSRSAAPYILASAQKFVLEETLESIDRAVHRQAQLEAHLETVVAEWRMKPVVEALQCLRGVAFIAATVVVSELGDLSRFAHRASSWPI